jgi:type I restriction-modification system DNA methylase subunit
MEYHKREDIPVGFGYVEDTIRGRLANLMNEVLKEVGAPFEYVDQHVKIRYPDGRTRRFPDFVIWDKKGLRAACLIELKPPIGWTHDLILNDAQSKATAASPQIKYVGTWTINDLFLWKTFDPEARTIFDRRVGRYKVTRIKQLRDLDKPEIEREIRAFLKKFFKDLEEIYFERREIPKPPVDEFFIANLRSAVDAFDYPIAIYLKRRYEESRKFRERLNEWFVEQGWTPPTSDYDFERTARQFLYLLMDKLLFYNTLRLKYRELKQITIPQDIDSGDALRARLQEYFDIAEQITGDYETIFATNFIESIPLPKEIIPNFRYFINGFSKHDFSQIGLKDIGRIFDSLIPDNERHKLGQYFTRPDVVDLINGFCIRRESDIVADFGCGAGTFLVRSYARLKELNPGKQHKEVLSQLYGVDIAKFPAHLSTISLAVRDLSSVENYPQVICKDFFQVYPTADQRKLRFWLDLRERISTLGRLEREIYVPFVDAVVGNPPYTRQEELEAYIPEYKKTLEKVLKNDWGKGVTLGKRAGIHAYFFLHGLKFLKEGGRFGYITSNSWLDVDYGKYLQEFFLTKTKIIAIIESKVERWFEEADVNTAITIVERCYSEDEKEDKKKKRERDNNLVKFVQLLVPLSELIPQTDDEAQRFAAVEKLVRLIESKDKFYEDDRIRIFPKRQGELWEEGYDEEKGKYVGSKWGKYIRAPQIFFKILEKGKDLFVPLKEVAEVRFGIKTGANEFFYLTEEDIQKWGIEREFWMHREDGKWVPNYVIKSPRECKGITVDPKDLKYRVLMIHKDKDELKGTNVLKYIQWGEEQGFHKRPTCRSRKRWYDLGIREPALCLWEMIHFERLKAPWNNRGVYVDHNLFEIVASTRNSRILAAQLNSTLFGIYRELFGRVNLGQGSLKTEGIDIKRFIIIPPEQFSNTQVKKLEKAFNKLSKRPIGSVFEEIGADKPEDVRLDKVKPDRRQLDEIIMGEILGLTEEEQLEVYRAVVDLVRSRIEKAKSVSRKKKSKGPDPDALADAALREIDLTSIRKFPDEYISEVSQFEKLEVPAGHSEIGSDLNGFYVKVGGKRINCEYPEKAEYIHYAVLNGVTEIKIPKDEKKVREAVVEYRRELKSITQRVQEYLRRYIPDRKLRERVWFIITKRLTAR